MAKNRIEHFVQQHEPQTLKQEPFAQLPACFHEQLSDERYRAMQQLYQTAYERARQQSAEGDGLFLNYGAGI